MDIQRDIKDIIARIIKKVVVIEEEEEKMVKTIQIKVRMTRVEVAKAVVVVIDKQVKIKVGEIMVKIQG